MDKINNLNQTVELMLSEDYKERFIAEYVQVKIRAFRIARVLNRVVDKSAPDYFETTCSFDVLAEQLYYMANYLSVLENRSLIENIDLPEVEI